MKLLFFRVEKMVLYILERASQTVQLKLAQC